LPSSVLSAAIAGALKVFSAMSPATAEAKNTFVLVFVDRVAILSLLSSFAQVLRVVCGCDAGRPTKVSGVSARTL
jgi:hypothetical protein